MALTIHETLFNLATEMLEAFEITDINSERLQFSLLITEEKVLNFCNIDEIPEGLFMTVTQMVVGKYLSTSQSLGDLPEIDVAEAFKSLKLGDMTINVGPEAYSLETLISTLENQGLGKDGDLLRYRRINW